MKVIIMILLIIGILLPNSQDLLTRLNQLKQFEELTFDASQLESERDSRISAITTTKKGEFETTAMYNQRLADAKRQATEIEKEYDQKIKDAKRLFDERKLQIRSEIQKLLETSRETTGSTFTLGKYEADKEQFPIDLTKTGSSYQLKIPISIAPDFKDNQNRLTASGYRQLTESGDWEYFGWTIDFKGNRFAFGPDADQYRSITGIPVTSLIPPDLSVQIAFSEPSGDDRLDAGETAELVVTITNKGKGPAYGVEIVLKLTGSTAIDFPASSYLGEISPGKSASKRLNFLAREGLKTGKAEVLLSFKEQNGFAPNDQIVKFDTQEFIPPELKIVDFGVDDFNKNARIEPAESVTITVRLQNLGNGAAETVNAEVNIDSKNVFFYGNSQKKFNLGTLNPGDYKDFSFDLISNKKATDMPVSITVHEHRGRFGISDYPLNLKFDQVQQRTNEMVISAKSGNFDKIDPVTGLSIDVERSIPTSKTKNKDALGIIFGIEQYKNITGVTFAKRDAAIINNYFESVLGISSSRIYYITNEDVTKGEFDKIFAKGGWLNKRVKSDSDIFLFYAGHGSPLIQKKQGYLIPYDGDPNYPSQTGYGLEELYENLEKLNARSVTVFLDACFSGANREDQPLLADARPPYIEIEKPSARGITVFSASQNNEISSAYPEKKHGLFTYFLLKGLQGSADTNNDGRITVGELGRYIQVQVPETAGMLDREQHPDLVTNNKDRILVRY